MMKCQSCNSTLKVIEYQARSADEAQRIILRCPNCPLNVDDFCKDRINIHIHLKRRHRIIESTPTIDSSSGYTLNFVYCRTKVSNFNIDKLDTYPVYATNYIDESGHMFKHYHDGEWRGKGVCILSKSQIAPNIKLVQMKVVDIYIIPKKQYKISDCLLIDDKEYVITGDNISLYFPIKDMSNMSSMIEEMYLLGFDPLRLSDYISQTILQSVSNLTARAYDRYSVADYDHKFSVKPDGQRLWMTRIGSSWLFSRRLDRHSICGWKIQDCNDQLNFVGPIIDIEFVVGFGCILIDVLMDEDGKITNHQRNLGTITRLFTHLQDIYPLLSMVHVRPFYDTYDETVQYGTHVSYPTDGIVAISNSGTDMFKIKIERSMELQLMQDGTLCTSDNNHLFSSNYNQIYEPDSILELRFVLEDDAIKINNIFRRSDKTKANDTKAVDNIIQSFIKPSDDTANIIRTAVWRWSNNLRSSIYELAHKQLGDKHVILDIGTGAGQSLDSIISMENISFVFVEPDPLKCKQLMTRLKVHGYHKDPRSVIPVVSQLRKGNVRYHILNCTAAEIVNDEPTMHNLKHIVGCCVSSYSAQFVIGSLELLTSTFGINVIGCCYLYNDIDVGSSIINEYGLMMKRISDNDARVKWGTDTQYDEPALESDDISDAFVKIQGINLIGSASNDYDGIIRHICSHVWVLRSR